MFIKNTPVTARLLVLLLFDPCGSSRIRVGLRFTSIMKNALVFHTDIVDTKAVWNAFASATTSRLSCVEADCQKCAADSKIASPAAVSFRCRILALAHRSLNYICIETTASSCC